MKDEGVTVVKVTKGANINWGKRKAVLFQSDDWGYCGVSPNIEIFNQLRDSFISFYGIKGEDWGKSTLENIGDMDKLFSVLENHVDSRGKHPCFHAAYVVSNPDFERIAAHDYTTYFDVVLPKVPTLYRRGNIIQKARDGMSKGLWCPTYNGRSQFKYNKWLRHLQDKDTNVMNTFKHQVVLTDSYEYDSDVAVKEQEKNLKIGLERFKEIFSFVPTSTIAPSYIWQEETEKLFSENGIKIIQGKNYQETERTLSDKIKGKVINIMGYKASDKTWQIDTGDYNPALDVTYLKRNVYFEPEGLRDEDIKHGASGAYKQILHTWQNNEPAIIITHRINYVNLDSSYVGTNIEQLDSLLSLLEKNHPDVCYVTEEEIVQECLSHKIL